jgi:DNA excision repair protein ERCC-4
VSSCPLSSGGRQEAYRKGGILSVTSRILVVDMLNKIIPTATVAGMLVLHAEKCAALLAVTLTTRDECTE